VNNFPFFFPCLQNKGFPWSVSYRIPLLKSAVWLFVIRFEHSLPPLPLTFFLPARRLTDLSFFLIPSLSLSSFNPPARTWSDLLNAAVLTPFFLFDHFSHLSRRPNFWLTSLSSEMRSFLFHESFFPSPRGRRASVQRPSLSRWDYPSPWFAVSSLPP